MEEVLGQEMEKKLQGDRKFTKQVKSGRILLEKKRCVPKFEHNASKEWGYIHESRSKNYTLSSLKKFKTKYAEQLHIPYVLHTGDFKEEDGIVFLPLYMTPLL